MSLLLRLAVLAAWCVAFSALPAQASDDMSTLFNQARGLYQAARYAEAELAYRRILSAEPGQAQAWYGAACCAYASGHLESAEIYLRTALRLERGEKAAAALMARVRRDEFARDARFTGLMSAGTALYRKGNARESLVVFQQAEALIPNVPDVHFSLALCYRRLHAVDKEQRELGICLALDPHHSGANYLLGVSLLEAGQDDKGAALLDAVAANPSAGAYSRLAQQRLINAGGGSLASDFHFMLMALFGQMYMEFDDAVAPSVSHLWNPILMARASWTPRPWASLSYWLSDSFAQPNQAQQGSEAWTNQGMAHNFQADTRFPLTRHALAGFSLVEGFNFDNSSPSNLNYQQHAAAARLELHDLLFDMTALEARFQSEYFPPLASSPLANDHNAQNWIWTASASQSFSSSNQVAVGLSLRMTSTEDIHYDTSLLTASLTWAAAFGLSLSYSYAFQVYPHIDQYPGADGNWRQDVIQNFGVGYNYFISPHAALNINESLSMASTSEAAALSQAAFSNDPQVANLSNMVSAGIWINY